MFSKIFKSVVIMVITICIMSTSSIVYAEELNKLGITSNAAFEFGDVKQAVSDPRQTYFVHFAGNPVITGEDLTAPCIVANTYTWNMYCSGKITSTDSFEIYKNETEDTNLMTKWSSPLKVVPKGIYEAATDPSVVREINNWTMALTTKRTNQTEWISIITSTDGNSWSSLASNAYEISFSGATVSQCARPSLIKNKEQNRWELYFDGYVNGSSQQWQHVAYSTESVPKNFIYQSAVGDMINADVKLVKGLYMAAYRHFTEASPTVIRYATSTNGISFTENGTLLQDDPLTTYDNYGVAAPCWLIEGGIIKAIAFSGASTSSNNNNKIGIAFPQANISLRSNGGAAYHGWRQAIDTDTQRIDTLTYNTIDWVYRNNYSGGPFVINEAIIAEKGDRFSTKGNKAFYLLPRVAASSSSQASSTMDASKAIDGNLATMFSSAAHTTSTATESLTLDIGTKMGIKRLILKPRSDGYGFPVNFSIEYSNDNTTWTQVAGQNYTNFPNPGTGGQDVVFSFASPAKARYLRIEATKLGSAGQQYYLQFVEASVDTFGANESELPDVSSQWELVNTNVIWNFTNLYNPKVIYDPSDSQYPYKMWLFGYANQYTDDVVYFARSSNLNNWEIYSGAQGWDTSMDRSKWVPVLTAGNTNYDNIHNGDPSVVLKDGVYYMAFSSVGFYDRDGKTYIIGNVMGATSTDGINWTKSSAPILIWDKEYQVGQATTDTLAVKEYYGSYHRPSIIYDQEQQKWKMWFDYFVPGTFVSMGYAENSGNFMTPSNWNVLRKEDNPVIRDWVNPSVIKVDNMYYSFCDIGDYSGVMPASRMITMAESTDGLNWTKSGYIRIEAGNTGTHVPEAFYHEDATGRWLYVFYAWQPTTYPYNPEYKSIRYIRKQLN